MRHVFYIHSYITFLVAEKIILTQNLQPELCVFMYGRKFQPAESIGGVVELYCPYTHFPVQSFALKLKFWKSWKELKEFDSFVRQITGGEFFIIYTNQTGIDFIRLFLTHKYCKGFNFLEEGIASYHSMEIVNKQLCPAGSSSLFFKCLLLLNYKGRLNFNKQFYDPNYSFAFGISKYSFPAFKRKIELSNPFINQAEFPQLTNVLVLDGTAEYGLISDELILKGLIMGFAKLVKMEVNEIWVKYHPDQLLNPVTMRLYRSFFDSYQHLISVKELSSSLSLEMLAGNQKLRDLKFFVFLSSVGLYAGMAGRKVISFALLIAKLEPEYLKLIDSLPKIYKDMLFFIEDDEEGFMEKNKA